MIELLYLYGMALSTAENKGVSPFVKISEQAFTAFFRVEFRGGIAKGNVGALDILCQTAFALGKWCQFRVFFSLYTRGVGGCPLGGVVGASSPYSSAAPCSPLASADISSPRPLRAQLCLLIRDLIPSRFIFTKKSSKICVYQKKALPLPSNNRSSLLGRDKKIYAGGIVSSL